MSTEFDGIGMPASPGRSSLDMVSDPLCTSSELTQLAGRDATLDRIIARHRNAGPVLLHRLAISRDSLTKQGVAGNSNTSLDTLFSLVDEFAREFILNPAFNRMVLENPDMLESRATATLMPILKQPECPVSILHWAANRCSTDGLPDRHIMQCLVKNPSTPPDILEYILGLDHSENMDGSEGWL